MDAAVLWVKTGYACLPDLVMVRIYGVVHESALISYRFQRQPWSTTLVGILHLCGGGQEMDIFLARPASA